jgi:hypothetical protein
MLDLCAAYDFWKILDGGGYFGIMHMKWKLKCRDVGAVADMAYRGKGKR